jgi:hypothetical protein
MNGTPHGHILILHTWLKSEDHISGFLHNINSSVKRTAESTVMFTLDGHRSHIRPTEATATDWQNHVTLYCLKVYTIHKS